MNYLELCQATMREGGISGALVSVSGQSGELLRVVNWVNAAYRYVLNAHEDWLFLTADVGFDVSAPNTAYTAAAAGVTEFGEWRFVGDDWRAYNKAAGVLDEQPVRFMPYDRFRRVYQYGAQRLTTGRPQVVTERPDQALVFWPTPDAAYTIVGQQFRCPANLVANADVPVFAAKFHDVIVWRALMFYAEYEGDGQKFASAQVEAGRLMGQMESRYLPDSVSDGPAEPMA